MATFWSILDGIINQVVEYLIECKVIRQSIYVCRIVRQPQFLMPRLCTMLQSLNACL